MSSIDYDLKKIRAVVMDVDGVLSPQTVDIDAEGEPLRMTNVHDGSVINYTNKRRLLHTAIITGARTERVVLRYNKLGIKDIYTDVSDKLPRLIEWMQSNDLQPEEVAYIGDDMPDVKCLDYVGLPCCPADATADAKDHARWISRNPGGAGCVRQLFEEILKAQGKWGLS